MGAAQGSDLQAGRDREEQTYYRWCKDYRGLQVDQARRLKELYQPTQREGEDRLTQAIIELAKLYGRRFTEQLQHAGWRVGKDRVERIWYRDGLKVLQKQKPRGR